MSRFYPESDHAQVYGVPGVMWQQRGLYFTRDGRHVPGDPDLAREVAELRAKISDPDTDRAEKTELRLELAEKEARLPPPEVDVADPVAAAPKEDGRSKEVRELKLFLSQYGEPWQGLEHARAWAAGQGQ